MNITTVEFASSVNLCQCKSFSYAENIFTYIDVQLMYLNLYRH